MGQYHIEKATFTDFIIASLLSCRSTVMMRRIMNERVKKREKFKNANLSQALQRLQKRGLLKINKDNISFSYKTLQTYYNTRLIRIEPKGEKKIIIIFDIPEDKKKVRDWLRNQIKFWGFKMIQKSVWLGKGPLPKEFNARIHDLGIDKNIRIFTVQNTNI